MASILVIEDEESLREMIVLALSNAGHSVLAAVNGSDGQKLIQSQRFDLVVTDLVMPEQDGIEMLMSVRKTRPDLPIIAMSGTSPHSALYLTVARQLGAKRMLFKPFPVADLITAIEEIVGSAPTP